jgi:hypothetical protein
MKRCPDETRKSFCRILPPAVLFLKSADNISLNRDKEYQPRRNEEHEGIERADFMQETYRCSSSLSFPSCSSFRRGLPQIAWF